MSDLALLNAFRPSGRVLRWRTKVGPVADAAFRVGEWDVFPERNEFVSSNRKVKVEPRVMQVLVCLAEHAGKPVNREHLIETVWGKVFVTDEVLTNAIAELRKALGDDYKSPRFIQTLPKKGYRLIAPVRGNVSPEPSKKDSAGAFVEMPDAKDPALGQEQPEQHGGENQKKRSLEVSWLGEAVRERVGWPARRGLYALGVLALMAMETNSTPPGLEGNAARQSKEPLLVLVGDFVNRTGDPDLDGSLSVVLGAYLEQSPAVRVLPDSRARANLSALRYPEDSVLDEDHGIQVCLREGVPLFIGGAVEVVGGTYLITARIIASADQKVLHVRSIEVAHRETLLKALGTLAEQVRTDLGESRESVAKSGKSLEQITTSSLPALRLYTSGHREHLERRFESAVGFYKNAIRIDPGFALAYARLGLVYKNLGKAAAARDALGQAVALIERVSDPERYLLLGIYHLDREEYDAAIENLDLRTRVSAEDYAGHFYLSACYVLRSDLPEAVAEAQRAFELNESRITLGNLVEFLIAAGDDQEALRLLQSEAGELLQEGHRRQLLGLALLVSGDYARALKEIERLEAGDESSRAYAYSLRLCSLLLQGRWRGAQSLVEKALQNRSLVPSELFSSGLVRARILLLQGRRPVAVDQLHALEGVANRSASSVAILAGHYALVRDVKSVQRLLTIVEGLTEPENARHRAYRDFVTGCLLAAQGRWTAASYLFREAVTEWNAPLIDRLILESAVENHEWAQVSQQALQIEQRAAEGIWRTYPIVDVLLARYYAARAHEATGNWSGATRGYQSFVDSLPESAGIPEVDDARRRLRSPELRSQSSGLSR